MVPQKKIFGVENLAAKFSQAKAVVLTDYNGLTVGQISKLRRELKKQGAEFEVTKNTLLSLAANQSQFPLDSKQLSGPTAVLWLYEDNPGILKTLYQFIKENELPNVKIAFWSKEQLTPAKLQQLANLPSLNDLRAHLLGTLQSPLANLVYSLNWNTQKLLLTLKALGTKKA